MINTSKRPDRQGKKLIGFHADPELSAFARMAAALNNTTLESYATEAVAEKLSRDEALARVINDDTKNKISELVKSSHNSHARKLKPYNI